MILSLYRPLPDGFGYVSQHFGENPAMYAKFGLAGHAGLDYGVAEGTPVMAAHAGRVVNVAEDPAGYGLHVRISGTNYTTLYAHLSAVFVALGEVVRSCQTIGASGNTGNSTGPHLHWALRVDGMRNPAYSNYIDPVPFRDVP
jgi:murein DD-endopeptidase MepM/ murein hydrolase activator NlpD